MADHRIVLYRRVSAFAFFKCLLVFVLQKTCKACKESEQTCFQQYIQTVDLIK